MLSDTYKASTMPNLIIFIICVSNTLFFFQGLDTLFSDWTKTFWQAIDSNQHYSWVMMVSTMMLTGVNLLLVILSLYYLAPNIDLIEWWSKIFKRKHK